MNSIIDFFSSFSTMLLLISVCTLKATLLSIRRKGKKTTKYDPMLSHNGREINVLITWNTYNFTFVAPTIDIFQLLVVMVILHLASDIRVVA